MKIKRQHFSAIARSGNILLKTADYSKTKAIDKFIKYLVPTIDLSNRALRNKKWRFMRRLGYKAVRVIVEEQNI